jgi:hypothetical protein
MVHLSNRMLAGDCEIGTGSSDAADGGVAARWVTRGGVPSPRLRLRDGVTGVDILKEKKKSGDHLLVSQTAYPQPQQETIGAIRIQEYKQHAQRTTIGIFKH